MAISIKKLMVEIDGDETGLAKATKRAERDLENVKKKTSDFSVLGSNVAGKLSEIGGDTKLGSFIGELGQGTTALGAVAGPAAIAAGVILGVGAAAVYAGQTLFSLAQSASDYGSSIKDAQEKTGLSVETLSALKFAAEASGAGFDSVSSAVTKFSKLIGEANQGNKEAAKTLTAIGIDPKAAINDLDGALEQAYNTIKELPEGVIRTKASMDLFGKSAAELLPVFNFIEGDFDSLIQKASELGLVLTEEDVKAADDFGDTLGILQTQAAATSAKFALEFAPQITSAMQSISETLADNRENIKLWGGIISDVIWATKEVWNSGILSMAASLTPLYSQLKNAYDLLIWIRGQVKGEEPMTLTGSGGLSVSKLPKNLDYFGATSKAGSPRGGGGGGASKSKEKSAAEKAAEDAKKLDENLQKTLKLLELENTALQANTTVREAEKLALDLQAKGYDKLIPYQYEQLLATQKQIDAEKQKIETYQKSVNEYKKATEKFDDFVKKTLENTEKNEVNNPYLTQLRELDAEVFNVIKNIQTANQTGQTTVAQTLDQATKNFSLVAENLPGVLTKKKGKETILPNSQENAGIIGEINYSSPFMPPLDGDEIQTVKKTALAIDDMASSVKNAGSEVNTLQTRFDAFNVSQNENTAKQLIANEAISKINKEILGVEEIRNNWATAILPIQQSKLAAVDRELNLLQEAEITIEAEVEANLRLKASNQDNLELEKKRREEMEKLLSAFQGVQASGRIPITPVMPIQSNMQDFGEGMGNTLGGSGFGTRFETLQEEYPTISDEELERIAFAQEAYTQLGQVAGQAIGALADGMGALVEQWVLYGDLSGEAAKKAIASALAMASSQAAASAIMETAYGIAALTPWGAAIYGPAGLHFKAAALFGAIAVGTGLAGRAVAGDSFKNDANKNNSVNSPDVQREDEFSRTSGIESSSNRAFNLFTNAVNALERKINSMPAGEVLTTAAKQKPGIVTGIVTNELKTNRTATTEFGKTLGLN